MDHSDLFKQALQHHKAGQWAEARSTYERYLSLSTSLVDFPNYSNALTNLGSVCRQLGDLPAAHEYLERAIEVAPRDATAHYNLGNLYRSRGDLHSAIRAYHAGLACTSTSKQSALIAYNLALSLFEIGDVVGAEEAYRKTLIEDPTHVDAALNLATLLALKGCLNESLTLYKDILVYNPDEARVTNNLAILYQDMGQIEKSLETIDAAIRLQPDLPNPLLRAK